MYTVKKCDFSNVIEIKNATDNFYMEVIEHFSVLLKMDGGFDLYFFEENKPNMKALTDKDLNPNTITPFIRSFDKFHCELLAKASRAKKLKAQKEESLGIFEQETFTGSKEERVCALLESMGYKKSSPEDSSRVIQVIEDVIKNLRLNKVEPTVVSHYKINEGKAILHSTEKYTFSSIKAGNYLYLSTSQEELRMVYSGIKIAPRIGSGKELIWKKARIKWRILSFKLTWIS